MLESYTMDRSHRDISSLMYMKPEMAVLYRKGEAIEELIIGDTIVVKPGERIPADGIVTEGVSAVNQGMQTSFSLHNSAYNKGNQIQCNFPRMRGTANSPCCYYKKTTS